MSTALSADSPLRSPALRLFLGLAAAAFAAGAVSWTLQALGDEHVWLKDLRQDWLQAKALAAGLPAYEPLPSLADRFIGPGHPPEFPMATPHPPFAALLCLPLAALSYPAAAAAWLALCLAALAVGGWWLYRAAGGERIAPFAAGLFLSLAWHAVWADLVLGQFGLLVAVPLVGAWIALREGRDGAGGAWLGAALALKMAGWPIVAWLVLERRWRAVGAAVGMFGALHVASLPVVGVEGVRRYYTEVTAQASEMYGAHVENIALASLGPRLFAGTGSSALLGIEAAPLIDAPQLARVGSLVILAAAGLLAIWGARRATGDSLRRFDAGYAIFCAASVVANPIAWGLYLTGAAVPAWIAVREWQRDAAPPLVGGAAVALALAIPSPTLQALLRTIATDGRVPFVASLLSLTHLFGVLGLIALIVRLTSRPRA